MLYNRYAVLIIITLFFVPSCSKKFLDVDDASFVNRQTYVKDITTMQHFLNGIYITLSQNFEHGNAAAYPEIIADNIRPVSVTSSILIPHYTWNQQADQADVMLILGTAEEAKAINPLWRTGYLISRACSFVIDNVDKYKEENPLKAGDIKGQAYALRAYVYFKMVNSFAQSYNFTTDASHPGIPYVVTSDITQGVVRHSVAEVYNKMIEDLKNAVENMNAASLDTRYININAAKALLARVYLFKDDYANAKSMSVELCDRIPIMQISDGYPDNLFKFSSQKQMEVLFQLVPRASGGATNFVNRYYRGSSLRFKATNDIASILKEYPTDVRNKWVSGVSGDWNVTKFPVGVATDVTPVITVPENSYYQAVIRMSEMFLTAAEASAKLGDEDNARIYLNAVRRRANPSISVLTTTGTALIDSIYKERRKELAFESLRMYDLQRWKLGVQRKDALFGYAKDLPYPSNKAIAPIPPMDVDLAGVKQNIGY